MTPDRKRGLRRIAIVTLVPYFSFWALVTWGNYRAQAAATLLFIEASNRNDWVMAGIHNRTVISAGHWLERAMIWGAIAPTIAAILLSAAWWVYRGFKPVGPSKD